MTKTIAHKIHAIIELEKVKQITSDKQSHALISNPTKLKSYIEKLKKDMRIAAGNLEFEEAAKIRDQIKLLEEASLELG